MTTAKTMQDNGMAPPAVGNRLDRAVRAVRYGWTPIGMIEDYSGTWIAANEQDCRTCRNFRGTQHCHSVLRCVDGLAAKKARPLADWHEEDGPVLWWRFPVEEPPYCGSPNCDDWPGYHTHWTPLLVPEPPAVAVAAEAA